MLSTMIKIVLTDQTIQIAGPDVELRQIEKFETYDDAKLCFSKGGYDPRKLKHVPLMKTIRGVLVGYAGLAKEIMLFCKKSNIAVESFEDKRTHFDFQKKEYTYEELRKYFNPGFKYVAHQIKALQTMLSHNKAIIAAPTSAGKSSIFSAFIRLTGLPALVVVDRATLGAQIADTLRKDGIDCGFCSGSGVSQGFCMVSTIQSVKKIQDLPRFKCVILDECFPGDTPVLTKSGLKRISELVESKSTEEVWCFNSENRKIELKPIYDWYKKETEYDDFVQICFGKAIKIESTPNHEFYVLKNSEIKKIPAENLSVGDKIVSFGISENRGKFTESQEELNDYGYRTISEIRRIKPKNKTVYNISVKDNHNYFIGKGAKVLVSNCHKDSARTFQEFHASFGCPLKYGFSASPSNGNLLDFARIRQHLGSVEIQIHADELMENEVMAKAKIYMVKCPAAQDAFDYQSAYELNIIHNERRNGIIADIVDQHKDEGYICILINNIEHGEILEKMIPGSVFLKGENNLESRLKAIEDFKAGKIGCLIATKILNEGISITEMRTLIMAGGQKSTTQSIQKIGRVLRISKEKKQGVFYDFVDEDKRWLFKHSKQRLALYKKEGYNDITLLDENLEEVKK